MKNEGKVLVSYRAVSTSSGGAVSVRVAGKLPSQPISLERIVATNNIALAWKKVKSNKGAPGIDGVTIEDFPYHFRECWQEIRTTILGGNYTPKPGLRMEIEKTDGGIRPLGIPTVSDRVAQMVVKIHFEPTVEPFFHEDSYGYRPRKSAIQAIEITRKRCWRYDWLLEFDIKGLFDNIGHDLLIRAVRHHTECSWVILYIERWLKAPFQKEDGTLVERPKGTPQVS